MFPPHHLRDVVGIKAAIQEYILRSWSLVKMGTTANQKKLFWIRFTGPSTEFDELSTERPGAAFAECLARPHWHGMRACRSTGT
jgi:hypothetical protein